MDLEGVGATEKGPDGTNPFNEGQQILAEAVDRFRPVRVFALFSGGHDSLCSAHLTSQTPRFDGCVHINTGIGIEETREFVRATCRKHGWPLREYHPPMSYEEIVLRWGFPGPAGHSMVYGRLKERCLRQLVREHKTGRRDRVLLVSGIRRQESRRRMGYDEPIQADGARVWVAPLLNWSHDDKHAYLDAHALDRNPVVERLCMSGECLCGAFARKGELDEIAFWYPQAAARIRALEEKAAAVGVPCRWGQKPPNGGRARTEPAVGLCWSCEAKKDAEDEATTLPAPE
jgi:3'-phosphoadenosine 5'-phosphosulfate sulfotransferase (PAPS reductase)/FAD synthetase